MELAQAAQAIAEALPDDYYPSAIIYELRGRAWKEYATACRDLGRYQSGLDALDRAENAYRNLPDSEPGLAAIGLSRAIFLWNLHRYAEALPCARSAAHTYKLRRDLGRYIEAQEVEAVILQRTGDHLGARAIYQEAFDAADCIDDPGMKARAARNLGINYRDAGDLVNASKSLLIALDVYGTLGMEALAARTRWSIARLYLMAKKYGEAEILLRAAVDDLEDRGFQSDAAEARLDLARTLTMLGRNEHANSPFFIFRSPLHTAVSQAFSKRGLTGHSSTYPKTIEFIISHYLRECFRARSVARASELAQRLHANRATLSRAMTEALGRSLLAELRARQLEEAARLLRMTDLKLAEVASRSAFGDRSTFFRVFRAAFEMTPNEYRNAARERQQNTTLRP
jgi:AraC-like DNA-binding protein